MSLDEEKEGFYRGILGEEGYTHLKGILSDFEGIALEDRSEYLLVMTLRTAMQGLTLLTSMETLHQAVALMCDAARKENQENGLKLKKASILLQVADEFLQAEKMVFMKKEESE